MVLAKKSINTLIEKSRISQSPNLSILAVHAGTNIGKRVRNRRYQKDCLRPLRNDHLFAFEGNKED